MSSGGHAPHKVSNYLIVITSTCLTNNMPLTYYGKAFTKRMSKQVLQSLLTEVRIAIPVPKIRVWLAIWMSGTTWECFFVLPAG